MIHKDKEQVCK